MQDPQAPPVEEQAEPGQGGGVSQMIADTHTNLLKIQEAVSAKFPEDGGKFLQVAQAFQSAVDGLGQAPGAEQAAGPSPATSSPEAGTGPTQQVY